MEVPPVDYTPTLPVYLRKRAHELGEHEFVVSLENRMSYAEAERTSRRVGKDLVSRGAGKGSRIGFMLGNGTDWVVAWLAISRIGAIAMPFSTAYRPAELIKALKLGDVDTLILPPVVVGHDQLAFVETALPSLKTATTPGRLRLPEAPYLRSILVTEPVERAWAGSIDLLPHHGSDHPDISDEFFEAIEAEVSPADPIFVIFTSGTTAEPKGVIHTHGTWVRHAVNVADCNDIKGGHRVYGGMPLFWIGGVSHTLGPIMQRGNTFLTTEKFDAAQAVELMLKEKPTQLYMFPNMVQRLREYLEASGADVSSVPAFANVAPPAEPGTKASSLGMTETCAAYVANGPLEHIIPEEFRGAFGFPVPYMQYKIVDLETGVTLPDGVEGEICVRGYNLMAGMCKKERHDTFDDDGFYHTGDKGYFKGGYIFFGGRAKDLIKSSGANVAPREVEVLLDSYPEILMSVVMGVIEPDRGETVGAVVVRALGATVDPVEIVTRVNRDLSSYKVPRRMLVIEESEMPYLSTGKPDRAALKARVEADGVAVSPRRE